MHLVVLAFRLLTFPLGLLLGLGPRAVRVRWMELLNRAAPGTLDSGVQALARALVEPYVLFGDFVEMATDPFGFQRARQLAYGGTFVHGRCVVFTDYATVHRHMTQSTQRKAHMSPITGQDKHPLGPVSGQQFFISVHDDLYKERRKFLAKHLFRPSITAIDGADAVFKACKSVETGTFDADDVTRTMTQVLNAVILGAELSPSHLELFVSYSFKASGFPPWILSTLLRSELKRQQTNGPKMRDAYRSLPQVQAAITQLEGRNATADQPIPTDLLLSDLVDGIQFAGVFGMTGTAEQLAAFIDARPEMARIVKEEADTHAPDGILTVATLAKMEKTNGVTWEAMRLNPTPMAVLQVAEAPFEAVIRGRALTFPAGTPMSLSIQCANRDPAAFPDPDAVVLDRPVESYINFNGPFSGAPRGCMGSEFAFVLCKMFLVNMVLARA